MLRCNLQHKTWTFLRCIKSKTFVLNLVAPLAFHMSVQCARDALSDVFTAFICLFVCLFVYGTRSTRVPDGLNDSFVNNLGKT